MNFISEIQKEFFSENGYVLIENLLTSAEVDYYSKIYNSFLDNSIDTGSFRSDLSGDESSEKEKITQIMVPSRLFRELLTKPVHIKTLKIARELLGNDMGMDFDMLINKAPNTNTITPWHQDAAYWIDMPDTRAVSCWTAIDSATKDNGCMWYTPGSHKGEILPHVQTGKKGALKCEGSENSSVCIELGPGSCVFHDGKTLHYSRGNNTDHNRRALIINFRPISMIEFERSQGYDHTGERKAKS